MKHIDIAGIGLEVAHIPGPAERAPLVFLHEGLGSVAMWQQRGRHWPAELCAATGRDQTGEVGWLVACPMEVSSAMASKRRIPNSADDNEPLPQPGIGARCSIRKSSLAVSLTDPLHARGFAHFFCPAMEDVAGHFTGFVERDAVPQRFGFREPGGP